MDTFQEITINTVHPIWYRPTLLAHRLHFKKYLLYIKTYLQTIYNSYQQKNEYTTR